jgi:hypothetical protein
MQFHVLWAWILNYRANAYGERFNNLFFTTKITKKNHRRSILFTLSLFDISGIVTIYSTPVSLFPHVVFPRVVINMDAGDRPAERMMIEATWPAEEAVRIFPLTLFGDSTWSR